MTYILICVVVWILIYKSHCTVDGVVRMKEGDSFSLECTYTNSEYLHNITWYKTDDDGSTIVCFVQPNLPPQWPIPYYEERLQMHRSADFHGYTLHIDKLGVFDGGMYTCSPNTAGSVINAHATVYITETIGVWIQLTGVFVVHAFPKIVSVNPLPSTIAMCITVQPKGVYVHMTWTLYNGHAITNLTSTNNRNGTVTWKGGLWLVPTMERVMKAAVCNVWIGDRHVHKLTLLSNIEHNPTNAKASHIFVGHEVHLYTIFESNPKAQYRWTMRNINGSIPKIDPTVPCAKPLCLGDRQILYVDVASMQRDTELICYAFNKHGVGELHSIVQVKSATVKYKHGTVSPCNTSTQAIQTDIIQYCDVIGLIFVCFIGYMLYKVHTKYVTKRRRKSKRKPL